MKTNATYLPAPHFHSLLNKLPLSGGVNQEGYQGAHRWFGVRNLNVFIILLQCDVCLAALEYSFSWLEMQLSIKYR
jgi:hypothetical protein